MRLAVPLVGWPRRPGPTLDWLVGEARALDDPGAILAALCARLQHDGVPLARATLHTRTLHPQLAARRWLWRRGHAVVEMTQRPHGIWQAEVYRNSPMRVVFENAVAVRHRLSQASAGDDFPIYRELRSEGLTDYAAMPLEFRDGQIHSVTWATDRPAGFATEHLLRLYDLLPALTPLIEVLHTRRLATTLLDTYVGHRAGERVLAGEIRRGVGETVRAAIWYCDLRDFTALSYRLERDALIATLNDYFDRIVEPVAAGGGEVLKFIGDAVLAIFPTDNRLACERALHAARAARSGVAALSAERAAAGLPKLDFGLALHVGDVMYGNIGSRDRLDFTVIGPAVNLAVRLEGLCREMGGCTLVSGEFVRDCPGEYASVGTVPLRGVAEPVAVFRLPADRADDAP